MVRHRDAVASGFDRVAAERGARLCPQSAPSPRLPGLPSRNAPCQGQADSGNGPLGGNALDGIRAAVKKLPHPPVPPTWMDPRCRGKQLLICLATGRFLIVPQFMKAIGRALPPMAVARAINRKFAWRPKRLPGKEPCHSGNHPSHLKDGRLFRKWKVARLTYGRDSVGTTVSRIHSDPKMKRPDEGKSPTRSYFILSLLP